MSLVVHLITTLAPGGAQTMLANVVAGSGSHGGSLQHVVIEMMSGGVVGEALAARGIPVYSLGMRRGRPAVSALWRLVRLLRRLRADLLQTWLYHADLAGLLAVQVARIPIIWNIRSAWHYGLEGFVPKACARLSRWPAAVIVNSRAGMNEHIRIGYRPRRWCLIPNGFDLDTFRPDPEARAGVRRELGVGEDARLIGIAGRWDAHKDYETFLLAASLLAGTHPDVRFVMVGEGLSRQNAALWRRIEELELTGRIHLLGHRADVNRVFAAIDIAACTSVGEAFPNVVGEAMAAGVPCVATAVGDVPLILEDQDLLVPPRDAGAVAAACGRLFEMDAAQRHAKGLAGRKRIASNYSVEAIVGRYERLYEEIIARDANDVVASAS